MKYIPHSVLKNTQRKLMLILLCILLMNHSYSQMNPTYSQKSSDPNEHIKQINRKLKVLSSPSPDVIGGYIRNNSYEGVKGKPFLFDEFKSSMIRIKEFDDYLSIDANIDLKTNTILYKDQELDQFFSIPSHRVEEVIIQSDSGKLVFRPTGEKIFTPKLNEMKFYQVLKEGPIEFIKIPFTIFIPADYTGAYTAKRTYDEYKTEYYYYLSNSDKAYKQIRLTKKSLIKVFPEKRELIKGYFKMKTRPEEIILTLLESNPDFK